MKNKKIIEFRKDAVSGEWVLISSNLQKKPVFFKRPSAKPAPKSECPFEEPRLSRQEQVVLWLPRPGKKELRDWWVRIFPNKYPAVLPHHNICSPTQEDGLYEKRLGIGSQEVVVTRDHLRPFGLMKKDEIKLIIEAYQSRYQALASDPCIEYILIIHNAGSSAGATVPHPHSQIFAIPITPPDVARSLLGSRSYFHTHKRCVHCDMLKFELKEKKRIIYQNRLFIVLAPYASRVAFEIRIFPKIHESNFEIIDQTQREALAKTMQFVFSKIIKKLNNPDYNFFIHTAPPSEKHGKHYHWHIEILPRMAVWGGLELGAGIDVVKISPEETANILKK